MQQMVMNKRTVITRCTFHCSGSEFVLVSPWGNEMLIFSALTLFPHARAVIWGLLMRQNALDTFPIKKNIPLVCIWLI